MPHVLDIEEATRPSTGSWVEVNLATLEENIRHVQAAAGKTRILFVVKSNAYGHGLDAIARKAAESSIQSFAVAYVQEALAVRKAAPEADILVMGVVQPDEVAAAIEQGLTTVVVSVRHARRLNEAAARTGGKLPVHVKVDTGMGRLGIDWTEAEQAVSEIERLSHLRLCGACTHFSAVEPSRLDGAEQQMERFHALGFVRRGDLFTHASSSRAFLYGPAWDHDGVRIGIALYGYGADEAGMRIRTKPILQWKTRVMQVRNVPAGFPVGYYSAYVTPAPTTLAVLSVGYADGFPRLLSNRGDVLIRGRRCRVVGRVSMNWVTVDAGPAADVEEGDEAVLIGVQGREALWAGEMARLCSTIPYEVLTHIHAHIPRFTV